MASSIKESAETQSYFEKCIQSVKKLNISGSPKDTLYHYTNFSSLKGVIESKEMWLTNYKYLNDTSEVKYSIKLISNFIENQNNLSLYTGFYKYIANSIYKMLEDDSYNLHVTSFCKHKDYLPAWRWYADDACGFAIGFKQEFFSHTEIDTQDLPADEFNETKVYYAIEQAAKTCVKDLINLTNHELDRVKGIKDETSKKEAIDNIRDELTSILLSLLPNFKHHAYKEEAEHRIIHSNFEYPKEIKNNQHWYSANIKRPFVDSKPYIPYSFKPEDLCEILVGPEIISNTQNKNYLKC